MSMNTTALVRVINRIRQQVNNEMTLQQLGVLLVITEAGARGTDHATLIQRLDLQRSQASKIPADLSDLTSKKARGPGLVEVTADPMDLRVRIIRLTAKGQRLMDEVLA